MADWKGVNYSDNDMLHMQQEAIRRVRQMQQRSMQTLHAQDPPGGWQPEKPPENSPPAQHAQDREPAQDASASQAPPFPAQGGGQTGGRPSPPHPQQGGRPGGQQPSFLSQLGQMGSGLNLNNIGEKLGNSLNLNSITEKLGSIGERLGIGGHEDGEGGISNIISSVVGENSPIGKVLAALNIDNERLLLIGLLLVLMNEKADRTLVIALFYLLL